MSDQSTDRDPEIRRRAAWLLGMLGLVAALLVLLMVTFFNNSGGDSDNPDVSLGSDTQSPTSTASGSSAATSSGSRPSSSDSGNASSSPPTSGSSTMSSSTPSSKVSCPSKDPCALDSDVGNAIAAINAYRADEKKPAVPGSVSDAAKSCALARGKGCDGGWAETELPTEHGRADGAEAVDKIKQFAKLLSDMKAIEVGWAYDPGSKTLYFATIRQT